MMKLKMTVVLIIAALAFSPAARVFSQENKTGSEEAAKPELKWTFGTVSQVAFVKSFLLVTTDQGYIHFEVTDNTTIMIGPEKVGLEDIQPEDSVRIQYYSPAPDKYVAVTISESKKEENSN